MIELLWESDKNTDLLPSDWFEQEGYQPSRSHNVRGPRGGVTAVKCAVTVNGRMAEVDYGGDHRSFNEPRCNIGVTRLVFENAERERIEQVLWKPDKKQFVDLTSEEVVWDDLPDPPPFDPTNLQDGRIKIERIITQRQGGTKFRDALLLAYDNRCAITGCTIIEVLEAAHISPYRGNHTDHVTNGLLLRADIHTLFDRGLIKVHGDYRITAREDITDLPDSITLPKDEACRPNKEALDIKAKLL